MDHHAAVKTTITSKSFWVWVHTAGGRWGGVALFFALFVGDHVGLFPTFNSHSFIQIGCVFKPNSGRHKDKLKNLKFKESNNWNCSEESLACTPFSRFSFGDCSF